MTSYLWAALCFFVGLAMAALGDMVSEEVRDRLDHLPHAILRLAAGRLTASQRTTIYHDEWLPELTYILKGDEARPITRLIIGTRYALGVLANASRIASHLHRGPTQVASSPRSTGVRSSLRGRYIYMLVLLPVAAANFIVFYPLTELVLSTLSSAQSMVVSAGFTGAALLLAQFSGTILGARPSGAKWFHILLFAASCATWLALGTIQLWIRLAVSSFDVGIIFPPSSSSAPSISTSEILSAALFTTLYAGTGFIAMIGGYLSRKPLHSAPR